MPQRVSDLLGMTNHYSPEACLRFDEHCVMFALKYERMRDARVEADAPKRAKKARPKVLVPKHSEAELLGFLGVEPEDDETIEMVQGLIAEFDWDAAGYGAADEDDEGEPDP